MKRSPPPGRKTPLPGGKPLTRTGELKRGGPIKRAAPLHSSAPSAAAKTPVKPAQGSGIPASARRLVYTRSKRRCERCAVDLSGGGGQVHHRRPRGAGGSSAADTNSLANLVHLCGGCHTEVESRRAVARAEGWLVRQGHDPAAVPLLLAGGVWELLDAAAPRYAQLPGTV